MKKLLQVLLVSACCGAVFAANYSYQGNGTDPNDWFDDANWSDGGGTTNWPTAGDNALFTAAGKDMVVSQVVPLFGQLQAGRGVPSMVTLAAGCVMTNTGSSISGILNNGKGTLVVDGGTLITKQIQFNTAGGTGFIPSEESSMQLKSGILQVGITPGDGGDVLHGITSPGTVEVSGGSLTVQDEYKFYRGWLDIVGSDATISVNGNFYFGLYAVATELSFALAADGSVSKISADSISFAGTQILTIDGTFAETGAEQTLVLIELTGADTFSTVELDSLTESLELINMSSGSLSLSGDSTQLIFTGKPVPTAEVVAWEFNTVGDTEGWAGNTGNTHLSGVGVSNAINGSETVLTSADVDGGDPQVYYNQSQAAGSIITLESGRSWRTAVIRLRQLDANPDAVGVASKLFNSGATLLAIQSPFHNFLGIDNDNPLCSVKMDADNWIIATYDISGHGENDLTNLRLDPIGGTDNTDYNFEVDYVRLYAGVSQPQVVRKTAAAWEFNTLGAVEGWTGNAGVIGLTASLDIDGSNSVMTCSSTTGDPQWSYTNGVDGAAGAWDTLEFRARQLEGGAVTNWSSGGTVSVITGVANITGFIDATDRVTQTDETNGWTVITLDISECSADTISSIRLDFTGQPRTIEVDWIRVYKYERQTPYESWASQNGLTSANDGLTDDPDSDTFNNLYEYAFGGNPIDGASTGVLPVGTSAVSGGSNVLEYVYFKNSSPYSTLTYSLVGDNDLVNSPDWTDPVDAVEVGTGVYTAELTAVTNHIPTDVDVKFIRTKVE